MSLLRIRGADERSTTNAVQRAARAELDGHLPRGQYAAGAVRQVPVLSAVEPLAAVERRALGVGVGVARGSGGGRPPPGLRAAAHAAGGVAREQLQQVERARRVRESAREARGRGGVGRVRQPDVWRGSRAMSRAAVASLPLLSRVREQQLPRLHY